MISSVRRKGGPYTNQGDDLSHGKRLEEVIWRLLQILNELLLSCARSTPLNRLDRYTLITCLFFFLFCYLFPNRALTS